jgi:hypothetical protein
MRFKVCRHCHTPEITARYRTEFTAVVCSTCAIDAQTRAVVSQERPDRYALLALRYEVR